MTALEPEVGTVERWALDYVTATSLKVKLAPEPPGSRLRGGSEAPARRIEAPGRPPELQVTERADKVRGLRAPSGRARALHTFFHHELQAAELMGWAILAFPDTPLAFREGLLRIALDEIRILFGKPVEASVAPSERIEEAINRVYEREAGGGELESDEEQVDEAGVGDILDSDDEAPVIRWVNSLFLQAMKERASDIHIEPEEKEVIVRYRIDGELYIARRAPRAFMSSIVSRIKIESALNIAEKRLPQDGRITKKIAGKSFDIRVSTIPTSRGYERIVMRLLNKSSVLLDLPDLGFSARDYALMDNLIHRPDGIILVTGPTGSGKTTTLYSALSELNKVSSNISTAEDPVEYNLAGINQVQMHDEIGLNFAMSLRAFLRQDPDIIMVGEIRDFETAEIAVKAALTGHLVLSTLHTNDAPATISRLLNMGVEPFLITASVNLVLAQRLARKVCVDCRQPIQIEPQALQELGFTPEQVNIAQGRLVKGFGCRTCNGTGYKGRVALYEVMRFNDTLKEMVLQGSSTAELKAAAIKQGMVTLRMAGIMKVLDGVTTTEEILRVTMSD